jgi:hypothetical protein
VSLVILALAVARLARLIAVDTIFDTPREWVARRWPTSIDLFGDSEVVGSQLSTGVEVFRQPEGWYAVTPSKWAEVITCVWCNSIWLAIAVWIAYNLYPGATVLIATPLALSYVAGWLHDR